AGRPISGLSVSTSKALTISPTRVGICSASCRSRWPRMRCRSLATPGRNSTRATLFRELAGGGTRRVLAVDAIHQIAAHRFPRDAFSSLQEFGPASLCLGVKIGPTLGHIGFLGYGFQHEIVGAGAFAAGSGGDAGLQLVRQANGRGAHGRLQVV